MREVDIENEKMLFECMHIDDLEAYKMMKKNIEITPLNAPLSTHKLAIIANGQSPYGFSSISDNNGNWEYMGLGHSGACSLVTNLLKQLQRVKTEIDELTKIKNDFFKQAEISHEAVMNKNDIIEHLEEKLEKIKEIAKRYLNDCQGFNCDAMQEILQIIEE